MNNLLLNIMQESINSVNILNLIDMNNNEI